ncbi:MAG: bifunctional serine/threonine-protein kinase/formylglycine-generating enzyme family protein [Gemmatimonadales bacterium]|nr:bifunctional serine/threonine-protein kinase/formylglycine-generating enzyme family protein [Gemmatimonadales bacterium]
MATGALTPPDIAVPPRPMNMEDLLGQRLQEALGENYTVEGVLGAGGFAVVFLVRDLSLKRKLAVKVLSPDLIASKTVLERFRREAETVAQLHHPHIVPLHFIGQKEDLLYLAMECVEGDTLAGRIEKEKRLPPEDVARLLREIASALEHAHKRGVIHRDIKPHNVLIEGESGRALVTDFGIARTAEGASLTASGMVVGTPQYLSPEQVTGTASDHRADIYALGVMGYEMLAGIPPFTGPTPTAVMMKRLAGDPPRLDKSRPDIPQPLLDVISGCMATSPEDRFQSAGEVVRALGGATPASGGHPTAEIVLRMRRQRRRWTTSFGFAIAALVVVGAVTVWWWDARSRAGNAAEHAARVDPGMVVIPAGQYTIGRDDGPIPSRPAHEFQLDSFAIDAHEVAVRDFKAFANATRAPLPWTAEPDSLIPVTGVLWAEAAQYCAWRHDGGRLPTEEEWEASARGPQALAYPWGNEWDPVSANTASSGRQSAARVGSFPRGASASGVHDLIGNVWEWTSSRMLPYPGGQAPPEGADSYVIRGGAFNTPDALANPTQRGYIPIRVDRPALGATGFRCMMPLRQGTRARG